MRAFVFIMVLVTVSEGYSDISVGEQSTPRIVGDGMLQGQLSLSSVAKERDYYTAEMTYGRKAFLTLVPKIQAAVERTLKQSRAREAAAVVVSLDGRVLGLSGVRRTGKDVTIDRSLALETWAPAASVFKLVTVASLMEAGVTPENKVCYHGGRSSVTQRNLIDDPKRDHRCNNLSYGLIHSQNAIIAKFSSRFLEHRELKTTAQRLGFSALDRFALKTEPGRINLPKDKLGFARVSAGFRKSRIPVLTGALLANVFATKGIFVEPRIVDRVIDSKGSPFEVFSAPGQQVLRPQVAQSVGRMMGKVVTEGTARRGFHDRRGRLIISAAGKTGTLSRYGDNYRQYSWFVGFAPADKPKYAVAVLLANPRKWHMKAHHAARMILVDALK